MFLKRVRPRFFMLLVLTLLLLTNGMTVMAAGVRPLVIEMNVRPGDQRDFEINLTPGPGEELVDLTFYEPVQQLSGSLIYQLPTNPAFSATSWVTLDNHTVRVLPDAESKVTGTIRVPFSASGSHTVIVMVEPRPPEISSGIGFQVRYAVRLSIRVEKAGVRPTAEMNSLDVGPDQQGAPQIVARFQNTSALDYLVSGEVTIRDQDRRLVERITLRTPAGASSGTDTTRVYPGAEVQFIGNVTRPLPPGEYMMQAFLRYGDSGQILRNEALIINPGEYVFPGFDESAAIAVTPPVVEQQFRAGERKSQIFEFESMVGDPVRVEIALGEVMSDYAHSLVDWLELRSQPEFVLPGRAKTRLAMTIGVPRDAADGSYHGKASFKAYSTVSGELLSETIVPINVLVGTEHQRAMEVRSIAAQTIEEEGTYLSMDLLNSGNVAFLPQISAILSNEQGEFIERVLFELAEEVTHLLPQQVQQVGALTSMLEPGVYGLEIEVTHSGLEILTEKHQIVVTN